MERGKRSRGRPPRISRDAIVRTALALEEAGEPLSMKAVAERLGVQRPALYHHVADRDALIELVSAARLGKALDEAWMPDDDAGWQPWLLAFAHAVREGLMSLPELVNYQLMAGDEGVRQVAQVEKILEVLTRDGFDLATADRAVVLVGETVHSNVRAVFVMRRLGVEPHRASLVEILDGPGGERFPLMRATDQRSFDPDAQFRFDMTVLLAGLAAVRADQAP